MTDERRPDDEQVSPDAGAAAAAEAPLDADDWAKAFAAVEAADVGIPPVPPSVDSSEAAGPAVPAAEPDGTAAPTGGAPAAPGEPGVGVDDAGGAVLPAGDAGDDGGAGAPVDVEAEVARYGQLIEEQTLAEVTQAFLDKEAPGGGKFIRQKDGVLGATISDPDIYRVDPESGAPMFFNPDTGRPFEGSNPRAEAQEWVDSYNRELKEAFNTLAERRHAELEAEYAPAVAVARFTPTYDKLDPVRQRMFDALVDGHEVYLGEDHIGYDVDLDKVLDQVNRQVASIKELQDVAAAAPPAPTGPALDMPNAGGDSKERPKEFKNLAEAMEWEQDQQISRQKK